MIAITTKSSISVKPRRRRRLIHILHRIGPWVRVRGIRQVPPLIVAGEEIPGQSVRPQDGRLIAGPVEPFFVDALVCIFDL